MSFSRKADHDGGGRLSDVHILHAPSAPANPGACTNEACKAHLWVCFKPTFARHLPLIPEGISHMRITIKHADPTESKERKPDNNRAFSHSARAFYGSLFLYVVTNSSFRLRQWRERRRRRLTRTKQWGRAVHSSTVQESPLGVPYFGHFDCVQ